MSFFYKARQTTESTSEPVSEWVGWYDLVKRVVARFARGNIAAQDGRIIFPEEQAAEANRTRSVARAWRERARQARAS